VTPADCVCLCASCPGTGPSLTRGAWGTWCAEDSGSWEHCRLTVHLTLLPCRRLLTIMLNLLTILW
jgi:hypothetical protein